MTYEDESKIGAYGSRFEQSLNRYDGDPRSAIGANAIGRATSTNNGGWVPDATAPYTWTTEITPSTGEQTQQETTPRSDYDRLMDIYDDPKQVASILAMKDAGWDVSRYF